MIKRWMVSFAVAALVGLSPFQAVEAGAPTYRCSLFKLANGNAPGMRVVFDSAVDLTGLSGPTFYVECRLL